MPQRYGASAAREECMQTPWCIAAGATVVVALDGREMGSVANPLWHVSLATYTVGTLFYYICNVHAATL